MELTTASTIWVIIGIAIVFKVLDYITLVRKLRAFPTMHTLTSPNAPIGNVFPPNWRAISIGGMYAFTHKRRDYEKVGWNALAFVAPFPGNDYVIWVSDVGIIKQIINDRVLFPKPLERYRAIEIYGKNVVSTEGEVWKRQRRVSQPAFSEANNRLVWNAATNAMAELFEDVWGAQPETHVGSLLDVTVRVALIVLSIAGFGKDMNWKSEYESLSTEGNSDLLGANPSSTADKTLQQAEASTKHTMTFTQSLVLISTHITMNIAVPRWLKFVTSKTREVKRAGDELGVYMDELIRSRIEQGSSQGSSAARGDLLSNLVAASSREEMADSKMSTSNFLSHSELRGNTFVYLIAGHETTAHTLTYMYALLALYPGEQEKLYNHIIDVVGDREATFEDFGNLTRVVAAFYETLRMFPSVTTIAKRTSSPTVFANISAADPKSKAVKDMFVPTGSIIYIHTPGLHYNERYWPDPYTFKPGRFMGEWNKDAFLPFSGGPRACIGRRFSEVEAVAITVALLRNYSIHLDPKKAEEYERLNLSMHERTERLTKSVNVITLTPLDVPLVFRKRI